MPTMTDGAIPDDADDYGVLRRERRGLSEVRRRCRRRSRYRINLPSPHGSPQFLYDSPA